MAAPAAHTHAHAIRSIHQVNTGAPAILGDLDLARSIARSDPIVPHGLAYARGVVHGLKSKKELGRDAGVITEELVTSAVEAAHFADAYAPSPALEFQQMDRLIRLLLVSVDGLTISVLATNKNARIATRNSWRLRHETQLLYKITPDHGHALAQIAAQSLDAAILARIIAPPVPPAVATITPEFDSNIWTS